jgi:hypothetical protein
MKGILQDARFGLRLLGKSPGFMAVAMLTLSLGIAAVTNLFSFVNALILRPYPFPNISRIVNVRETAHNLNDQGFLLSAGDFRDWSDRRECRYNVNLPLLAVFLGPFGE